jgi:hypothetical protein
MLAVRWFRRGGGNGLQQIAHVLQRGRFFERGLCRGNLKRDGGPIARAGLPQFEDHSDLGLQVPFTVISSFAGTIIMLRVGVALHQPNANLLGNGEYLRHCKIPCLLAGELRLQE